MAASPKTIQLLALVEDIRLAIESDDAGTVFIKPDLLTKITNLRHAVEAPHDSLLRIYAQVSHYSKNDQSSNRKILMELILAIAECRTEGSC